MNLKKTKNFIIGFILGCAFWLGTGYLVMAQEIVTVHLNGELDYGAAQEVLRLANEARSSQGTEALMLDAQLQQDAMLRAQELALYYSHTRANGTNCFTAFTNPYSSAGENIATGQSSAAAVMDAWMNSEGHRANILKATYKEIGIGCFYHNGLYYWVQLFTNNTHNASTRSDRVAVTASVQVSSEYLSIGLSPSQTASLKEGGSLSYSIINTNTQWSYSRALLQPNDFVWKSSNSSLASVSATGQVNALSEGTVQITASIGSVSAAQSIVIDHTWETEYRIVQNANCEAEGIKGIFCSRCSVEDTSRRVSIPKLTHIYGNWGVTKAGSCTEAGEETSVCSVCDQLEIKIIEAYGHSYGDWITTREATHLSTGIKIRTCSICNDNQEQTIPKNNAFTVIFDANGGSVTTRNKKITFGSTYGQLPASIKEGYTFQGWYTDKVKGSNITASSTVTVTADQTLYARWSKVSVKKSGKPVLKNAKGKKVNITIKKVSGAAGYQVVFADNNKFKKSKTKTIQKLTTTVTKLEKNKTYYVKIRAYKKDSAGKNVYGAYSAAGKIRITR